MHVLIQVQYSAMMAAHTDAQEICRKLQKDNKQIREASQRLASTEAAIRCESRTQVDATLASISAK